MSLANFWTRNALQKRFTHAIVVRHWFVSISADHEYTACEENNAWYKEAFEDMPAVVVAALVAQGTSRKVVTCQQCINRIEFVSSLVVGELGKRK